MSLAMNTQNWSSYQYTGEECLAFLSIGSSPEGELVYYLNLTDQDYKDLSQKPFEELGPALEEISKRFGHWKFEQKGVQASSGGCSDCSAKS